MAEEGYASVTEMVRRMRQLSVQAANDTLNDNDRSLIQKEIDKLIEEIDRQGNATQYNTKRILQGTSTGTLPTSATWSALGSPWTSIVNAISNLQEGDQQVTFTFSFMKDGVATDGGQQRQPRSVQAGDARGLRGMGAPLRIDLQHRERLQGQPPAQLRRYRRRDRRIPGEPIHLFPAASG
jgi:flagellin-like hook-associated protein FlgL